MSNFKIYGKKSGKSLLKITKEGDDKYSTINNYVYLEIKKIPQPNILLKNINTNNVLVLLSKYRSKLQIDGLLENPSIFYKIVKSFNQYNNDPVCIIIDNEVIPVNQGVCIIEAVSMETENYLQTKSNQITITVYKKDQDPVEQIDALNVDFNEKIELELNGGKPHNDFIYTLENANCIIYNNMVIGKKAGLCIIKAYKPSDINYNEVIKEFTIRINKIYQPTLFLNNINNQDNVIFVNLEKTFQLKVDNILENANILFILSNPNVCSITNNIIKGNNFGTCEIYGITMETDNYLGTKTNKIIITVNRNEQSNLSIIESGKLNYLSSIFLDTIGGSTDYEVTYTSKNTNCKIINNRLIGLEAGLCTIKATKKGNQLFNSISLKKDIIINKIFQSNFKIFNINDTNLIYVNPDISYELKTSYIADNARIIFQDITPTRNFRENTQLSYINNNKFSAINEGICIIQAVSLETNNYFESVSEPITIHIIKNDQSKLNVIYEKTINYKDSSVLKVTGGSSDQLVTTICQNTSCIVKNLIVYGNKFGLCPIDIIKPGNFMYNPIKTTIYIDVLPIHQKNVFITELNETNELEVDLNTIYNFTVSNTNEEPVIIYNIESEIPNDPKYSNVINFNSSNFSFIPINAGTCIIKATLLATANYLETVTPKFILTVILKSPINFFINKLPPLYYTSKILLTLANNAYNPDEFTIDCSSNLIKLNNNEITGSNTGEYKVYITKKKTFDYDSLTKKIKINVYKIKQPNFKFIDVNNILFVDTNTQNSIMIKTSLVYEDASIIYKIVSEQPLYGDYIGKIDNNGNLFLFNEGILIIEALSVETDSYLTTSTGHFTITVKKYEQPKIFFGNMDKLYVHSSINILVFGGLPENSFEFITNNNDAYILNNTLYGLVAGEILLTAIKKGNNMFYDTNLTIKITIYKIYQNIKLYNINNNIIYNEPNREYEIFMIGVKENAGLKYNLFHEGDENTCYIKNNKLIPLKDGTCKLQISTAETKNYLETNTNYITLNIIKRNDNEIIIQPSNILYFGSFIDIHVITQNNNNDINIITNNDSCLIQDYKVIGNKYGSCILTIEQNTNDFFEISTIQYNIFVKKIRQDIRLENIAQKNIIYLGTKEYYDLKVSNIQEDAVVKFNIIGVFVNNNNSIPCYIKNSRLYPYDEGACIVEAYTLETSNFDRSITNQILIHFYKQNQKLDISSNYIIDFNTTFDLNIFGDNFDYAINNNNCFIINKTLYGKQAGTSIITISKESSRYFNAFTNTFSIEIKRIYQKILLTDFNKNNTLFVNPESGINININNIQETPNIIYNISDLNICYVSENKLFCINEGTCEIYITLSQTTNYLLTSSNKLNITIKKNIQSNLSIIKTDELYYNSSIKLITTGGSTDLNVKYISSDLDICTVINDEIIGKLAKSCTITAIKPGNFMYYDISNQIIIKVNKIYQPNFLMNNINSSNTIFVNPDSKYELSTSNVYDNCQVVYKLLSIDFINRFKTCSINGNIVTPILSGKCLIQAIALETNNYLETVAESKSIITIKNNQNELLIMYPPKIDYNNTFYLETNGGNTNIPVTYSVNNENCTIDPSNNLLKATLVGESTITAFKEGNFMYNSIQKIFNIIVVKIYQQNILIDKLNEINEIEVDPGVQHNLNVLNINDNPLIKYEIVSSTPTNSNNDVVCVIKNNRLSAFNRGSCIIKATVLETDNYLETVTETIKISVRLKKAEEYTIDKLRPLYYQTSINLTINKGYFDENAYELSTIYNNIRIEKNKIIGLNSGDFIIIVKKKATFMFTELIKEVKSCVYKIIQPDVNIINFIPNLFVNPSLKIPIQVNKLKEDALIKFEIIGNNTTNGENNSVCILDHNKIYALNNGSCFIKAITAETNNYKSTESLPIAINVQKNVQNNLKFIVGNDLIVNKHTTFFAEGGDTNNNIEYSINNENCYIKDNTIFCIYAGETIITAIRKGNFRYHDVESKIKISIKKANQNVQLNNVNFNNEVFVNPNIGNDLICYGALENPEIYFTSSNKKICLIRDNKLFPINVGTCIIEGVVPETMNYLATKTNRILINVILNPESKLIIEPSGILYVDSKITLNVFSSIINSNTTIIPMNAHCKVIENVIYGISTGNCLLKIINNTKKLNKPNITYYNIKVNKILQNIVLENILTTNILYINPNVSHDLIISNIKNDASYIFNIIKSTPINKNLVPVCHITDNKLYALNEGTITIEGETQETEKYANTKTNQINITVYKNDQKQIEMNVRTEIYYKDHVLLNLFTGSYNNEIKYTVNNGTCTILNNYLIARNVGKCILTGILKESNMFNKVIKQINIEVKKIYQDNLFLHDIIINNNIFVNPASKFKLTPINIIEGATYIYNISNTNICSIVNDNLIPLKEGSCDIYFETSETENYLATKSKKLSITINKNEQSKLNIIKSKNILYFNSSINLIINGGSTDIDSTISINNLNCNSINNTIFGLQSGISKITIFKEGNDMYNSISSEININVEKIHQNNFILNSIDETIYVDPSVPLKLSTSLFEENATIIFKAINNNNIISIGGSYLYAQNEGECTVLAVALETSNYLETESNTIKIKVIKKVQELLIINIPPIIDFNSTTIVEVLGGSTIEKVQYFPIDNKCKIDENSKLYGLNAGVTSIKIYKEGDFMYYPIESVFYLTINKIKQQQIYITKFNETNELYVDPKVTHNFSFTNINENPVIHFEVLEDKPNQLNVDFASNIYKTQIIGLNAGYTIVKAITSETENYLITETPPFRINIKLKTPNDFIIDKIEPLIFNKSILLTVNNKTFTNEYEIISSLPIIKIDGNILHGIKSGDAYISVIKKATFMYEALAKHILVSVNKNNQLEYDIIGLPINIDVNPSIFYELDITLLNQKPKIEYRVLNNSSVYGKIIKIENNKLYPLNPGPCSIYAVSSETKDFLSGESKIFSFNVNKINQTELTYNILDNLYVNKHINIDVSGGSTSSNYIFTVNNNNCYIFANKIYGVYAGESTITVKKLGNFMYNDIIINIKINILKIKQFPILLDFNRTNTFNVNSNIEIDINAVNIKDNASIIYNIINIDTSELICIIKNNKLVALNAGTCFIEGIVNETSNYLLSKTNKIMLTIKQNIQKDLIIIPSGPLYFNSFIKLNVLGGNTHGNVTISPQNQNCTVNDNVINGILAGNCLLNITKAGNQNYETLEIVYNIKIEKILQDVILQNFNDTNLIYINEKIDFVINNVQENANITWLIINNEGKIPCKIESDYIYGLEVGSCIIQGIIAETENYLESKTNQLIINVNKKEQYKLSNKTDNFINFNDYITLNVEGGRGNSEITYISDSKNCVILNYVLIGLAAGNCSVYAYKSEDTAYNKIIDHFNIIIRKIKQPKIKLHNINTLNKLFVNHDIFHNLTVSNIEEDAKYSFTISDSTVCVIIDNKLVTLKEGTCELYFTTDETKNYSSTNSNKLFIRVIKNTQARLIINNYPSILYYYSYSRILSSGGSTDIEPIINSDSSNCKILNNVITGQSFGICAINIFKDGNHMYNPISDTLYFEVNKIYQPNFLLFNINKIEDKESNIKETNIIYVNPLIPIKLKTADVNENAQIIYQVILSKSSETTENIISINNDILYADNSGMCSLIAYSLETHNYLLTKSKPIILNIIKNDQSDLNIVYYDIVNFDDTYYLEISGGNTSNKVIINTDNDVCLIDSNYKLYANKTGICTVTAIKDGDYKYNSISKIFTITVLPINQRNIYIEKLNELNEIEVDPDLEYTLSVANIQEDPIYNYEIITSLPKSNVNTDKVCILKDKKIVPVNEGSILIKAIVEKTANYNITETQIIKINVILKEPNNYLVDTIPKLYYNSSIDITVNNNNFTNEYEITTNDPNISIDNNTITGLIAGECTINIIKKATFKYKSLVKIVKLLVHKIKQPEFKLLNINNELFVDPYKPILCNYLPPKETNDIVWKLLSNTAYEGDSVGLFDNNNFYAINIGKCQIVATCPETMNYEETETEPVTITIYKNEQSPLIFDSLSKLTVFSSIPINIYGGNTINDIKFNVSSNCYIANNKIYGLTSGKATITALKIGNFMYNDISNSITFDILKNYQNPILLNINKDNEFYVNKEIEYPLVINNIKENASVTYQLTSLNENVCIVRDNKLILLNAGVCVIKGILAETTNYFETITNEIIITVKTIPQDELMINSSILYYKSTANLIISGGSTDGKISIKYSNDKCTISDNIIYGNSSGKCLITITKEGNTIYDTIIKHYLIKINKIYQNITINNLNDNNMIHIDTNEYYKIIINNLEEDPLITFVSSDYNICNIENNKLIPLNEGICKIYAIASESKNYFETKTNEIYVTVIKKELPIMNINNITTVNYNDYIVLNSKFNNYDIEYKTDNKNCEIINNTLIAKKSGKCLLNALIKAGSLYNDKIYQFYMEVIKRNQINLEIEINNYKNFIYVNTNLFHNIIIKNIQENPNITWNISDSNICYIKNNQLFGINEGTCTIQLYANESENFLFTKSNILQINVQKNNQAELTLVKTNELFYRNHMSLSILGGSTDIETVLSVNDDNSKLLNNELVGLKAGYTLINGFKSGNFMYKDISSNILIKVNKIKQTNFTLFNINTTNTIFVNRKIQHNLLTSAIEENALITFKITYLGSQSDKPLVSIDNGFLYANHDGECLITAITTETDNFESTTSNTIKIIIIKNIQSDFIINYPNELDFKSTYLIEANGGNTENKIIFTPLNNICSININNKIITNSIGNCTLKLFKEGDYMYLPASKTIDIIIKPIYQPNVNIIKLNETDEIEVDPNINYNLLIENLNEDPKYKIIIVKTISDNSNKETDNSNKETDNSNKETDNSNKETDNSNKETDNSNKELIARIENNKLIPLNAGYCICKGIIENTNNYLKTETPEYKIKINLKNPANFIVDKLDKLYFNSTIKLTVDNGTWNAELFEISTEYEKYININNNVLLGLNSGQYTINVTKKATFQFKALTKQIKITVNKLTQPKLVILNCPKDIRVNPYIDYPLETNIMNEEAKIVFKALTNNSFESNKEVCVFIDNKLIGINSGYTIIKAYSAETTNYNASESTEYLIAVSKNVQNKLQFNTFEILFIKSYIYLYAFGGNTSNLIKYNVQGDTCYLQENKLNGVSVGVSVISAFKEGNFMYYDIENARVIEVNKINQSVKLLNINETNEIDANFNKKYELIIDGVKENPYIIYKIINTFSIEGIDVCMIDENNMLIPLNSGICIIEGYISETNSYAETKTNQIIITVKPTNQNELYIIPSGPLYFNSSIKLIVNGGNIDSKITMEASNTNCTISGNIIYGNNYGICMIHITKDGNDNFNQLYKDFFIRVYKIKQNSILENINDTNIMYINDTFYLNVSNIMENAHVKYEIIDNNTIAYIMNNRIMAISDGIITVKATLSETKNYAETSTNLLIITIYKVDQKALVKNYNNILLFNDSMQLNIYGISNDNDTEYILNNTNCKIINNTIIGINSGTCLLKAIKKGNTIFNNIINEYTIQVNKIKQKEMVLENINDTNTIYVNPYIKNLINLKNVKERPLYNYIISNNNICYIVDNSLIALSEGTTTLYIITSETNNYLSSVSNKITITIIKNKQTNIEIIPSGELYYNSYIKIYLRGGSIDNSITLTSKNNNCVLLNYVLIGLKAGLCKLTAQLDGNEMYLPTETSIIVNVNKIKQPDFILNSINELNTIYVNPSEPITLEVSDTYENPKIYYKITYLSDDNKELFNSKELIHINNGILYADNFGKCNISAVTTETDNYLSTETNIITLNIIKNNQDELIIDYLSEIKYNETDYIDVAGGNTVSKVTFTTNNDSCIINTNNKLIGNNVGICNIRAYKEGNNMYYPIEKFFTIDVLPIEQNNPVIREFNETNELFVDPNVEYDLIIESLNENPTINYIFIDNIPSDTTKNECIIIKNNKIIPMNVGYARIKATIMATKNYLECETAIFTVNVILNTPGQFIIDRLPKLFYNNKIKLTVNKGEYDPKIFTIKSRNNIGLNIIDNELTGLRAGKYSITITRNKTETINEITKTLMVTVEKLSQKEFKIIDISNNLFVDPNNKIILETTPLNENPNIIFNILSNNPRTNDLSVCSINNNILYTINEGNIVIKAYSAETTNYNSSESQELNLNIFKRNQNELVFNNNIDLYYNSTISISAFGGNTNNNIRYVSYSKNCLLNNNLLHGLNTGNCIITAHKLGNYMYNDITSSFSINIKPIDQNIRLLDINQNNTITCNPNYGISLYIEGIKEFPNIIYNIINLESKDDDICVLRNNKLYALSQGKCYIDAIISKTKNYNETTTNRLLVTVLPLEQDKLYIEVSNVLKINNFTTIKIIGGNTNNEVSIVPSNDKCTISGNIIYGKKAGLCKLKIFKNGNKLYNYIYADYNIKIEKIEQPSIYLKNINDTNTIIVNSKNPYQLIINNILENARVRYNIINNSNIALIKDNKLFAINEGTILLEAIVEETENYLETNTNQILIHIIKDDATDIILISPNNIELNNSINLQVNGDNNNIIYESKNESICKILNNILIGLSVGKCIISAKILATTTTNEIYKEFNFEVTKTKQTNIIIDNLNLTNIIYVGDTFTLNINNVKDNARIIYNIVHSDSKEYVTNCLINNNKLKAISEGVCILEAIVLETSEYLETKSTNRINITIQKKLQLALDFNKTLNINHAESYPFPQYINDQEIRYTSDSSNCIILNYMLIGKEPGECNVSIYSPSTTLLNSLSTSIKVIVNKIYQPRMLLQNIGTNILYPDLSNNYPLIVTGIYQSPNITYRIIDANNNLIDASKNIISIINNKLYAIRDGVCYLQAIASETKYYLETQSNIIKIQIIKLKQPKMKITIKGPLNYRSTVPIIVSGYTSTSPLQLISQSSKKILIKNKILYGMAAGKCLIKIISPADYKYLKSEVVITINVNKIKQPTLTIDKINNLYKNSDATKLVVQNIKDNASIKFTILKSINLENKNDTIAIIKNNLFLPIKEGVCLVYGTTSETVNYLSTKTKLITILITPPPPSVTPVAKPVTPVAKPVTPAAKPVTPAAKPVTPAAKPVTPAAKPTTPAAKPTTPAAKPTTPAAKPTTPAAKPTTPTTTTRKTSTKKK
jgi:hypothetical protein